MDVSALEVEKVKKDINFLYSSLQKRNQKYTTALSRYNNSGTRREDLYDNYASSIGYAIPSRDGQGTQTTLNVTCSIIDTFVSKISQAKVRPFFNSIGGSHDATKACRSAQLFFDRFFDEKKIYQKGWESLKDALTFDYGCFWIDEKALDVKRVRTWEFHVDPAEYANGSISRAAILLKQVPLKLYEDKLKDKSKQKEALNKNCNAKCNYTVYYDLKEGKRYDFIDSEILEITETDFEIDKSTGFQVMPFSLIWYAKPQKSFFGVSVVDQLLPLQKQLDELLVRLDAATRNGIINKLLVPKGTIKSSTLGNGVEVLEYTPGPDGGKPETYTPAAIHQQWIDLITLIENKMYAIVGVSALSAQSKKPGEARSGVMLETLEDIESERHNVLLQNFVLFLVDVAVKCTQCFPKDAEILPKSLGRAKVKWSDVRKQTGKYQVQFSATSSLSKDPSEKLQQINTMLEQGYLDKSMAASLLEMPDLEQAFSLSTASSDYCHFIIDNAIEKDVYEYYEVVDLQMLFSLTVKTLMKLTSAEEDQKILDRVTNLMVKVKNDIDKITAPMQQPQNQIPADGQVQNI